MKIPPAKKILPPFIPYVIISIGLLVFHNAWLATLGYHAGIVIVIALSKAKIPIKRAFQGKKPWLLLMTALAGAGSGMLLYVLWPLLSLPNDFNSYIRNVGLNQQTWPVFLAYFIAINPLVEEYFWRGYLSDSSKKVVPNDLLFSGYHLIVLAGRIETIWLIAVFFVLVVGAWFWRQANRVNGGLLASIISHTTADLSVMLTIYYLALKQV